MSDFAINGDGTRTFFLSGEIDMSSAPLVDTALAGDRAGGARYP